MPGCKLSAFAGYQWPLFVFAVTVVSYCNLFPLHFQILISYSYYSITNVLSTVIVDILKAELETTVVQSSMATKLTTNQFQPIRSDNCGNRHFPSNFQTKKVKDVSVKTGMFYFRLDKRLATT